jgi:hypothetical protein
MSETTERYAVTYDYVLPAHWAPALINGDFTGIECDSECRIIQSFMDEAKNAVIEIEDDSENFLTYHDAREYGIVACNCYTYSFTFF